MIRLLAAIDRGRGLAKHGVLPWCIPEDEKYFTDQTKSLDGHVLSGGVTFRQTYGGRPLVDRHNYILTRDPTPIAGATVVNDLTKFLNEFKAEDLWVAGGGVVFEQIMKLGRAEVLYLTHIDAYFACDTLFPEYDPADYVLTQKSQPREQNGFHFTYAVYTRKDLVKS
jgi:dihydrofolate reductase